MKLLRVGEKGKEKPAILDGDGKIRDISSHVSDLNPQNLNFETISRITLVRKFFSKLIRNIIK